MTSFPIRTRSLAVLFPLLLVAPGCTPVQWVKSGMSAEEITRDAAECRREAWREASWRSWMHRPLGPTLVTDAAGRRFYAWPAAPFGDPFGDRFFEESRLTDFCMRAKGYRLEPVEKQEAKNQAETIQPSPGGTSSGKP